ncbi:thiaminase II [Minwuia sp.]|uniref:thiaminase II n=1 Tax=Minwuia sp. TaxID=2493630 RepID=UPI003A8D715C
MKLFNRLKEAAGTDWQDYVGHRFVAGLADGSLPEPAFRHYLVQDYLFLIHFARAWALAVYKADNLVDMRAASEVVNGILNVEMKLHIDYCAGFGIGPAEMEAAPEDVATMAYTRYVLETGLAGDVLDLHVALAPCVIGYGEIGARLAADAATKRDGNPYLSWIEMYAGDEYADVMQGALSHLDVLAEGRLTDARFERLTRIFSQATRLETAFWQMGLDAA